METPEKIYLEKEKETNKIHHLWGRTPVVSSQYEHIEYIRKDIVDDMLKTAEDHAYFAGSEAMMERAVEWLNNNVASYFGFPTIGNLLGDLRKALIKKLKYK